MEASHKTHRPHIKVGKDEEEEEVDYLFYSMYGGQLLCNIFFFRSKVEKPHKVLTDCDIELEVKQWL